ncbi:hypothetical protein [Parvularcula marina]|uniref:hypothetical protein n=1 Tax=Parvularcula marina TaxID=2292771 RepID=UPI00351964E3
MGRRWGILGLLGLLPALAAAAQPTSNFPPIEDVVRGERYWNVVRGTDEAFGQKKFDHLLELMPPARNKTSAWEIWATEWTEEDERGYEAFVQAIGRSGCISIDDCLRSEANPYRVYDDEDMLWLGDCTDMVYVLRGYYSWKRGLPFSFQDAISIRPGKDAGTDSRYSKYGNRVVSRADVIQPEGRSPRNAPVLLNRIFNIVSTAMLRVHPEDERLQFADFYPVSVTREAVRPGTIAYDIYGHVSIVYEIEDDGRILLISSHPDYTVSREPYGHHVVRSEPELGSGLKAWRPIRLTGARQTPKGTYIGGNVVGAKNATLPDFSMEQYWGTHPDDSGRWDRSRFFVEDRFLPYYDWVRMRLRKPGTPYDPVEEMANATAALCSSFRARKTAVNLAVYAGVHEKPAPEKLPENIYGTYGDWERYATPSRDARLKTQAVELNELARDLIRRHEEGDPNINYPTGDLAAALFDVYDRAAKSCEINYKRSDDTVVKLNMHHAIDRIFDLSFDPYHCPERRWGAKGIELATCQEDADKQKWYEAQRYLRNDPDRTYDLRTNFSADELKDPARHPPEDGGIGRATPPVIDFYTFLEEQAGEHTKPGAELPATIILNSDAVNDEPLPPLKLRRRRR